MLANNMNSILILLSLIAIHQTCSPLYNNTLTITSISNEVLRIKLSSIFSNSDFHNITKFPVIDQFQIIKPIEQAAQSLFNIKPLKGFTFYKTSKSLDKFHQICILWYRNDRYGILYNQQLSTTIPQIDLEVQQVSKVDSTCYDFVRLEDVFVIDCSDKDGDYFSLQTDQYKFSPASSLSNTRRMDQMDNFIYRYDAEQVELYQYSQGELTLLSTLDQNAIRNLIADPQFILQITELKTHTSCVSILDLKGYLFIVEYNNGWKLINTIKSENEAYFHDIIVEKNIYVIYHGTTLFYKSITAQEYSIAYSTKENIKKVFLTENFIVIQEKEKISQFSESLSLIDTLTIKDTEFVLSDSQNGLLLAQEDKLIKYVLNQDYYFQAILPTIEENYQWITISQLYSPSQNSICKVYIKYKAVSLNETQIFEMQESTTFITQPLFEKSQDIKLREILSGPNIKYNIQNTDVLSVTIQQTLPVTVTGIYSDVTFRKILYTPSFQQSIYVIQQDEIFRVTTYTCDTSTRTQIQCQQLSTATEIPITFKDTSNQLWWLNYDSLFLAVFTGSKLDVYYLNYKGQSFGLLKTLDLEGEIQQITTDGQFLFVLVGVTVHVYYVSTQNQVEPISTLNVAQAIYSTQEKTGHLFTLYEQTLSLYFISKTQQTLLWQEKFAFNKINVALLTNQFVVLTDSNKEIQASVYNYQQQANIHWEKQLSFYDYSKIDFSTIQTNFVKNLLYIRGFNKWTQKDTILVYDIETIGQNALFIALDYPLTTQFSQADKYLFLLDNNKKGEYFYISGENFGHATIKQDYNQVNYTTINPLNFKLTNNDRQYIYTQPIQIVNRGEHIFLTLDSVSLIMNNETMCADLGQSWYSGQVQNMTMINTDKFTFKNSLQRKDEVLNFSPFIENLNETYLIQVMTNKVVLIKKEDLTQVEFVMDYNITNLLGVYQNLVFVEVTNQNTYYLNIIQCENAICHMSPESSSFNTRLKKVFVDERFLFLTISSTVQVYDYSNSLLTPKSYYLRQNITPQQVSPYILIKHMYENVYHFYSIDLSGEQLVASMYNLSPQSTNQFIGYNIRNWMKSLEIYVPDSMYPSGFFLIPEKDIKLLIVFSYGVSVTIKFSFDCSDLSFCQLTPIKQATIYQQFSYWYTFPVYTSTYVNENILSRVFLNQNTLQYELFLYDIESTDSLKLAIASLESPEIKMPPEYYQILSFVYSYKGQLHLLASAENKDKLNHYLLYRSHQVCGTEVKLEDTTKFELKNKQETINVQLHVKVSPYVPPPNPPGPDPDDNDSGHFPYWVIAPIVLGVAALGFLGYKCYQKKNKVDEDRLLMA